MDYNKSNWPEIYSIGLECVERYVHSREVDSPIEDHDVIAAGISNHQGIYDISRANFIGHVIFFVVGGSGTVTTPDLKRVLTQGDIMLIPAGCPARYQIHGDVWNTVWFDLANTDRWSWLRNTKITIDKASNINAIQSAMEALYYEIHNDELESWLLATHLIEQIMIYLRREISI